MYVFEFFILRRITVGLIFILSIAFLSANPQPLLAAQSIAEGYRTLTFPNTGVGSIDNEITGEKPESKLWWNDGYWWASMIKSPSTSYHIFRLNMITQDWEDTGVILDDRLNSRADVLWDGAANKLYVVSHVFALTGAQAASGQRGELFRYNYDALTDTYTLDSGFPVEVNEATSEALVLAKDSTGTLWVTYVQSGKVMVNHTVNNNDTTWGTPFVLPVGVAAIVDISDMSSIIAYNGRIGVLWSNQISNPERMYFATHVDGSGDSTADWTTLVVYNSSGDDHINLKTLQSDSEGHLYAVVKTSYGLNSNPTMPWIVLLACKTFPCTTLANWTPHTVWTTSDKSPTRPQLLIDTENRDLYIFSRIIYDLNNNKKGIYYKSSDLDNISFAAGDGTAFITSATESDINNPTTTKQTVNRTTGLVVLASDPGSHTYVHNCLTLLSPNAVCGPNAPASVQFTRSTDSVSENASIATITVTLSRAATKAVTVNYATSNGTATAGSDYTASSGSLTFAIGETSKTFTVAILNDGLTEAAESINLTLSGVSNATLGMPMQATLTINDDEPAPVLQVAPAALSVAEEVVGGNAPVTMTLSGPSAGVVQVRYASSNGSATGTLDFTPISNTLTFLPGQTSQVFLLPIFNDTLDEEEETVNLLFSNVSNAALPNPSAVLTIRDNDAPPTVQFVASLLSVKENTPALPLTITLSAPSGRPVTVNYGTTPGTASPGSDYTAATGAVTFNPGEVRKSVTLPILNDNLDENDETLTVVLSAPTNATLGNASNLLLTLLDDEIPLGASFSTATYNANEGDGKAQIMIKLSAPAQAVVAVGYTVNNGTALRNQDYQGSTTGTVSFSPGESSKNFEIPINNDSLDEDDETITLTLNNPSSGVQVAGITTAALVIKDNDNPPLAQWSTTNFTVNENASNGQAQLTVHLNIASGRPVSITYRVNDETATAENDYQVITTVLLFKPGETEKTINLGLLNDAIPEADETLAVTLTGATNASLGALQSAQLVIQDEDGRPQVALHAPVFSELENALTGSMTVTVTLNIPVDQVVTVTYATSDGSATADNDYLPASGTLTFAPGELAKSFTIALIDDNLPEENETIGLSLSNANNILVGTPANATLIILDNDQPLDNNIYLPTVIR